MTVALPPLAGRYWRMLGVRWQTRPFDSGSHLTGGRWNPPGTRALYLSADYNTAIREMHQDLVRPGTLVAYDLAATAIADLSDADPAILGCEWRRIVAIERGIPPSWTLADELIGAGAQGALVPSIQHRGGINLVLWRWYDTLGARGHEALPARGHDAHAARGPAGDAGAALTLLDPEAALTGGR